MSRVIQNWPARMVRDVEAALPGMSTPQCEQLLADARAQRMHFAAEDPRRRDAAKLAELLAAYDRVTAALEKRIEGLS